MCARGNYQDTNKIKAQLFLSCLSFSPLPTFCLSPPSPERKFQKLHFKMQLHPFTCTVETSHVLSLKRTTERRVRVTSEKRGAAPTVTMHLSFQIYNKSCSRCVGKKKDSMGMREIWGMRKMS